jgi:hypothetical protein
MICKKILLKESFLVVMFVKRCAIESFIPEIRIIVTISVSIMQKRMETIPLLQ